MDRETKDKALEMVLRFCSAHYENGQEADADKWLASWYSSYRKAELAEKLEKDGRVVIIISKEMGGKKLFDNMGILPLKAKRELSPKEKLFRALFGDNPED